MSDEGRELVRRANITVLVGATAAGRNTLITTLCQKYPERYHHLVSDTTRPPKVRDGVMEQDGVQYFFRNEDEVLADLKAGRYIEAALVHKQQISGTSLREIQRTIDERRIAIAEITFEGAARIHDAKPEAPIFFVIAPHFDEWMDRLTGRGDLQGEELRRRLNSALAEFDEALNKDYYHLFINDDLEQSAERLHRILTSAEPTGDQAAARAIVAELQTKTRDYLATLPLA